MKMQMIERENSNNNNEQYEQRKSVYRQKSILYMP